MEIWDEVIQEFNEEIQKLRITLGNGSAEDYPHYRQMVGSITSIEWCKNNLKHIIKRRMEDD